MSDTLRGACLYLDCASGIAGDMALGALLDLGVPEGVVAEAIAQLGLPDIALRSRQVHRGALVGRKVDVLHRGQALTDEHGPVIPQVVRIPTGHAHRRKDMKGDHAHRPYREIRALIGARCSTDVARRALAIFDRIAAAESRMHGVAVEEVSFHEVGAADSIADIVGVASAFSWLAPRSVHCRVVPLGGGSIQTSHGLLPVPAPATLELLRGCVVEAGGKSELTTPTGAAIVAASVSGFSDDAIVAERFGALPAGRVLGVGWGAGSRDLPERPNLLRVVAYEPLVSVRSPGAAEHVELLEANIDDMSGELLAPLAEALMTAGALDAWLTPITMKKGRPAFVVSALVVPERRAAVEEAIFRESTTLGVRRSSRERAVLDRELVEMETELGPVVVKLAGRRDPSGKLAIYSATPELEACRRLADARGLPLRRVYEIVAAAAAGLPRT